MYQDVVDLRAFYQSPLGKVAARLIRNQIRNLWPTVHGMEVLGLGYATPYLDPFRDEARHTVAIMPAQQGVIRWPRFHGNHEGTYGGNLCALAHERHLPLQDASMDRIVMVHVLEHSDHKRHLLREVWRTLAPGGRVLLVVPNRMGFWSRNDNTPFGHGTPYSTSQIRQMLAENMLTPTSAVTALALPPFRSRTMISLLAAMEKTGLKCWHNIAGVLIVEAEKQIYAADGGNQAKQRVRKPVFAGNQMRQNRKRHEE
ncbi:class I SAM-dependent methyltransferase [Emcibacter sp.]|uniref:class I SAM-dependent methyltransferase n=1 Tax=Emcibacter sp. TaxID=1979954 RepID=UPI003A8DA063